MKSHKITIRTDSLKLQDEYKNFTVYQSYQTASQADVVESDDEESTDFTVLTSDSIGLTYDPIAHDAILSVYGGKNDFEQAVEYAGNVIDGVCHFTTNEIEMIRACAQRKENSKSKAQLLEMCFVRTFSLDYVPPPGAVKSFYEVIPCFENPFRIALNPEKEKRERLRWVSVSSAYCRRNYGAIYSQKWKCRKIKINLRDNSIQIESDEQKQADIKSALGGKNDLEQAVDFVKSLNQCTQPSKPKKDPNAAKSFYEVFCIFRPPVPLKRNGKPAIPMPDSEEPAVVAAQSSVTQVEASEFKIIDIENGLPTGSVSCAPLKSAEVGTFQMLKCLFWSCYQPKVMDELAATLRKGTYKSQ